MIYVLYGQPGSGKTTLGKLLAEYLDTPFIIDGDEFRKMFTNENYGKEGRVENIRSANAVATYLNKKSYPYGNVIMALVNPYEHSRDQLKQNNPSQVSDILLCSERDLRKNYHVKDFENGTPKTILNTDHDVEYSWLKLKDLLQI